MPVDPAALPRCWQGLFSVASSRISFPSGSLPHAHATSRCCCSTAPTSLRLETSRTTCAPSGCRRRSPRSRLAPTCTFSPSFWTCAILAATRRGPAGTTLEANHTFSYDLQLIERADPTTTHNLRSLGLVADPTPIGYDPEELPSFRTCPQELDRLVILHGSCRQLFAAPPLADEAENDPLPGDTEIDDEKFVPPGIDPRANPTFPNWPRERPTVDSPRHDGKPYPFPPDEYPQLPKRDGMVWIDALIEARGPSPLVQRPHQLFLTGDQIYADQPPPPLLPALNTLARMLVGEEELGAEPTGTVFKAATLENFPPGFRGDTVRRSAGFTTSAGDHLLSFGEFVTYYLLTWSPELWKLDLWPSTDPIDPSNFDPSKITVPQDWLIRFLYKEEPVDAETRFVRQLHRRVPDAARDAARTRRRKGRTTRYAPRRCSTGHQKSTASGISCRCVTGSPASTGHRRCSDGGSGDSALSCRGSGARSPTCPPTWCRTITTSPTTGTSAASGANRCSRGRSAWTSSATA